MKNLIRSRWIVTGCLLAIFFICGCSKREIKNLDSKGKTIVCFGDSITWGYGADPGEDYPKALGELLPNYTVINSGVNADTTTMGLERFKEDALDKDPVLVIIEMCGNDFIKKVPFDLTIKNVGEMIDIAQKHGAMVALVDISSGMFLKDYRESFTKLAREKDVIFIPQILKGIITNPSMKSDFIHPNGAGYKIIAKKIYRVVSPYLEKNVLLRNGRKKNAGEGT